MNIYDYEKDNLTREESNQELYKENKQNWLERNAFTILFYVFVFLMGLVHAYTR